MKTFNQFITEANYGHQGHQSLDDYRMSKRSDTPLKVGRLGKKRKKSDAEKKRVKAIGGGKTAPAKTYKDRKDIGTNKPRSKVEQQPQKERGSAALSAKEAQKKAYLERKRKERGEKTPTRTQLLTKKTKTVDPKYKAQKATGYTAPERQKITRAGERLLKDIQKKKEKPASHYDPKVKK
tara:strand:- start:83 stop:622 length:540 start_codon:yes stop_codon:yes gene_type:complete